MSRAAHAIMAGFALFAVAMSGPVDAADTPVKPEARPSAPAPARSRLSTVVAPGTAYGCKRIWRCDAQVCEWRRGCWGVYGYVEAPYYSVALAKRQWERDGLPAH